MFGRKKRKERRRFYKRKGFWIFCLICLLIAGLAAWIVDVKLEPYREYAEEYDIDLIEVTEDPSFILDRKDQELGRMFVQNRHNIPLDQVPPIFVNAVLAQEDQRFYEHDGVDWVGVARAAYLNVKSRSVTQGAGTITMQLARNAFSLKTEKKQRGWTGYERKIVEAFLALRIEKHLQARIADKYPDEVERKKMIKAEILELYLNRVPFGENYYGVRSAALGYFGKEPKDLDVHECASIVACLKNPSNLNPIRHPKRNRIARDHVLRRMALEKMITDEDRDRAVALEIKVNPDPIRRGKSYLYVRIASEANSLVGEEALSRGGYVIRTTIDLDLQESAEEALRSQLLKVEETGGYAHPKYQDFKKKAGVSPDYLQGASLMIDHLTGEVLAYVGGRNYAHTQYDFIESGRRPLGTAFFPFIYAAAFDNGLNPATTLKDEQLNARQLMVGLKEGVVGEWGMEVPLPEYEGAITARRSLKASKISATVRLGGQIGLAKVAEVARKFGLKTSSDKLFNRMLVGFDEASIPEIVSAYSTFPRGGTRIAKTHYILEIKDSEGNIVYPVGENVNEVSSAEVCTDSTAFQTHSILNEVLEDGNLKGLSKGLSQSPFTGGAKSGTPYGFTDAWMVGYNGRITCATWVGFYKSIRKPIHSTAFAKNVAYPIWQDIMNSAMPEFRGEEIAQPSSIEKIPVCRVSGMRPTRYCNEPVEDPNTGELSFPTTSYMEYFRLGEELGICSVHGSGVNIDDIVEKAGPLETLAVIPVKPQAPLLLGYDPYESETPTLAPQDEDAEGIFNMGNVLIVEDRVAGEREALLRLPKPLRFELPEEEGQE